MVQPLQYASEHLDLGARFKQSSVVVASPAAGAITAVANLTIPGDIAVVSGIQLWGWLAFTVGTNGVTAKLDIRQTGVGGAVIATTGATTVVAANLWQLEAQGFDTAGVLPNQVYSLCLTVGSGSAASAVSSCQLCALVV